MSVRLTRFAPVVVGSALMACSAEGGPPGRRSARAESGRAGAVGDALADRRAACEFAAGARVADTLGFTASDRAKLPIDHVIVLMQENRSFDHYFGRMRLTRPEVEGIPDDYTNADGAGGTIAPDRATTTCIADDTPHSWTASHSAWNDGAMDGFFEAANQGTKDGTRAISWYDQTDLPFYYWLHSTFAMADHHFCSVLGPTWPNRDFLYAATSDGVKANDRELTVRTIYDALDDAGVSWGIYADGTPRQNCIGYSSSTPGVAGSKAFFDALAAGTLPKVTFLDGKGELDEHPPNDVQAGEAWVREVYRAVTASKLWPRTALIFTYDEGGGFFDHVSPPAACLPSPGDDPELARVGVRVPLVVVSPYSKPKHVSHVVHEHPSITRFIELMFDLPALTARDANSDALLDMFDFKVPALLKPATPPLAGTGGCDG